METVHKMVQGKSAQLAPLIYVHNMDQHMVLGINMKDELVVVTRVYNVWQTDYKLKMQAIKNGNEIKSTKYTDQSAYSKHIKQASAKTKTAQCMSITTRPIIYKSGFTNRIYYLAKKARPVRASVDIYGDVGYYVTIRNLYNDKFKCSYFCKDLKEYIIPMVYDW